MYTTTNYGNYNPMLTILNSLGALGAVAFIGAVVLTVLVFVLLLSRKKRDGLKGFWAKVADFFSFKHLYIEKFIQAIYIFTTFLFELMGFLMLFRTYTDWYGDTHWMGGRGLLIMIFSPIVIRLMYELVMMSVLLVKNVIQINSKLKDQTEGEERDIFDTSDIDMTEAKEALKKTADKAAVLAKEGAEKASALAKEGMEKAREAKENLEAKAAERKAEAEAKKAEGEAALDVKSEETPEA